LRSPAWDDVHVPIEDPVDRTVKAGRFALIKKVRSTPCRVTITAISNAEVGGVQFRTTTQLGGLVTETLGTEVSIGFIRSLLGARIEATTPEGVATLDITYVVKTGRDAA
jgi:hypothetical protein